MPIIRPDLITPDFTPNISHDMGAPLDVPFGNTNSFAQMRLQNMFTPTDTVSIPQNNIPKSDNLDIGFQPEHKYSDAYDQLISQIPHRDKPSFMRKLAASLSGVGGGVKAADEVLNAPYNEQMNDWMAKLKATEPLMVNERQGNVQQRQYLADRFRADQAQKKLDENTRIQDAKLEISRTRAAAYDWDKRHPNHILKESSSGYIISIDPKTGESDYVRDQFNVPIKSDKLPEEDKINLLHKGRMDEIELQSKGAMARTIQQGDNAVRVAKVRGVEARETKGAPSDTGSETVQEVTGVIDPKTGKLKGKKTITTKLPVKPTESKTPPPIQARKIGDIHKFPNGNIGKWNGKNWTKVN